MTVPAIPLPVPHASFVLVTPELAQEYLKYNTENRPLSEATVDRYAMDMRTGNWPAGDQGIGFDVDGKMINGQHRCHAVIKSGVPVQMLVVRGLPREARSVVDNGKPRSVSDVLHLVDKLPNSVKVSAASRIIRGIESRDFSPKLSVFQVREIYGQFKAGIDLWIETFSGFTPIGVAPVGGAIAYAYNADHKKVTQFALDLKRGANLRAGDPAHTLREFMLRTKVSRVGMVSDRRVVAYATLRAIYDRLNGREFQIIRPTNFEDSGARPVMEVLEFFKLANESAK